MTATPEPAPKKGPRVHGAGLTPYGMFLRAESYHQAAEILHGSKQFLNSDNPKRLLFYHAIEGYLRAFLRMNGREAEEIRSYMHDFARMYEDCETAGLVLRRKTAAFLRETGGDNDYVRVRYELHLTVPQERGEPGNPGKDLGRLISAAKELRDKVGQENEQQLMRKKGGQQV